MPACENRQGLIGCDAIDTLYELYKDGFMFAWTIGCISHEAEDSAEGGREFNRHGPVGTAPWRVGVG